METSIAIYARKMPDGLYHQADYSKPLVTMICGYKWPAKYKAEYRRVFKTELGVLPVIPEEQRCPVCLSALRLELIKKKADEHNPIP